MQSVEKFLRIVAGVILFLGAIAFMRSFLAAEERREDVVLSDMAQKSAVNLNLDGDDGNREFTKSEVLTALLNTPDSVQVSLEGAFITPERRIMAKGRGAAVHVPSGRYVAYYSFGPDGGLLSVDYRRL